VSEGRREYQERWRRRRTRREKEYPLLLHIYGGGGTLDDRGRSITIA